MTTNQTILLLDIYRGHNADIHPATHDRDIEILRGLGLITIVPRMLTERGEKVVRAIKDIGNIL